MQLRYKGRTYTASVTLQKEIVARTANDFAFLNELRTKALLPKIYLMPTIFKKIFKRSAGLTIFGRIYVTDHNDESTILHELFHYAQWMLWPKSDLLLAWIKHLFSKSPPTYEWVAYYGEKRYLAEWLRAKRLPVSFNIIKQIIK